MRIPPLCTAAVLAVFILGSTACDLDRADQVAIDRSAPMPTPAPTPAFVPISKRVVPVVDGRIATNESIIRVGDVGSAVAGQGNTSENRLSDRAKATLDNARVLRQQLDSLRGATGALRGIAEKARPDSKKEIER
jgi:hypothetical protein